MKIINKYNNKSYSRKQESMGWSQEVGLSTILYRGNFRMNKNN